VERVPEPELMEGEEQARAYALADFEEPHSRFIALFREAFPAEEVSGRVLDLGCGAADIALRFAGAYPRCRIDGLDGSAAMLRYGAQALARAGLGARVRLIESRLPGAALPGTPYDALISNSLLHHLADPMTLWQAVRAYGRSGAPVFIMDLMRPATTAAARALVRRYAADEPEVLQRDFHRSLLAAYRPGELRAQLARAGLLFEVRIASDRHLIVAGRVP
jgi:SAM-dependent methyltransferase